MVFKKIFYFFIGFLASNSAVFGQNLTLSPYSSFGTGEWMGFNMVHANQASQTFSGAYSYSFINPATLGGLKYAAFDFAGNYTGGDVRSSGERQTFNGGNMSYLGLSFAIFHRESFKYFKDSLGNKTSKKRNIKWNGAFSVTPFSSTGYNYTLGDNSNIPFQVAHSGKGGLTNAQFSQGISYQGKIYLGYSAGYLFGQINDYALFDVTDSFDYFKIEDQQIVNIRGVQHIGGIMFKLGKDSSSHLFGASFGTFSNTTFNKSRLARTLSPTRGGYLYEDTILYSEGEKSAFTMPVMFGIGYTYKRGDAWLINLDYAFHRWSSFRSDFSSNPLKDRKSYGLGITLNPAEEKNPKMKKFPVQYRIGFRYTQTQNYFISSSNVRNDIDEWTIGGGFGIPIGRRYFDNRVLKSIIHVQFDYTQRGKNIPGIALERYFRLTLGFNLGDIWFQRNKFN